jgi:hypothetical protein
VRSTRARPASVRANRALLWRAPSRTADRNPRFHGASI